MGQADKTLFSCRSWKGENSEYICFAVKQIMSLTEDIIWLSQKVREEIPLVHNITNYVTVNDCANAILAVGGSPVMADDYNEVCEITQISKALVLNMGTLNERTVKAMLAAGKRANELHIPVIFDPVGAGASSFRSKTAEEIIKNIKLSVIRGNLSELACLSGREVITKGVDVSEADTSNPEEVAQVMAERLQCVVAITGAVDVITDGKRIVKISNGTAMMSKVTGTGCMTTAITGVFHGVTEDSFLAAVTAITFMGIAGEEALRVAGSSGTGSFHIGILDTLSTMDSAKIKEMAKIEEL